MLYPQNLLLGAGLIVAAEFMLASMGAVIKIAAVSVPNEVIVFFRNLFGLLMVCILLLRTGKGLRVVHTQKLHLHIVRGLFGVAAMYCFYYALAHLKLSDAMILKLTSPLFIPFVALFWLRERISTLTFWGLLIGFSGTLFVLKPGFSELNTVMLLAILGSLFASVAKVSIRRLTTTEPVTRVVFYFALVGTLVSAIPMFWSWQTPSAPELIMLLAIGGLATAGQLFMSRGYASAPASQVAVFTYSSVLIGAGYGWLIWREHWDLSSVLGSVLVAAAGLLILLNHRRPQAV